MTGFDDTDRRIAAWFDDRRERVPERTIEAVLAHARTHPRRRDPLGALRRDPMGRGFGRLGGTLAPLPLVAAVGLLVVAALAGAAVGGLFDRGPAVVPVVSPLPSPSVPLSSVPPSSGPKPVVLNVDLVEVNGQDATIDITDESMTLESAESGQPNDGGSVENDTIQLTSDPDDPNVLVLTWTGSPCDTTHELAIAPDGRTMVLTRPACSGDSIPRDLQLRLRFMEPVLPADIEASLVTG
ncbi:MAG: hypothetical protein ACXW4T_06935 [Candidatus Limnocylindrales bacterium]